MLFILYTSGSNANLDLSAIIESLKMKPEDVTPQQQMKIQLIRNILAGRDPELIAKLLTLVSHGWSPVDDHESVSILKCFVHCM